MTAQNLTGYPSIDKPWLKYYTEEAVNAPLPECTAYDLVYRGNAEHLNDVALIYFDRKITYGRLFEEIENTASAFSAQGIRRGDIVILCLVNMPETVFALYALDKLGAVANLVDPRTNPEQLTSYINECGAKLILTVDLAYPVIRQAAKGTTAGKIVAVSPSNSMPPFKRAVYQMKNKAPDLFPGDIGWADFIGRGAGSAPEYAQYEKGRCFIIAHTGGTTGVPKGVMLSDDNINAVAHGYRFIDVPFTRGHKYFDDLPPFIIYGVTLAIHTTLCYGLQVILYPLFDSKGFPKLFAKYKPNHFSAVADHLKFLAESPLTRDMDLSFLVTAGVGGDTLNEETERSVNAYLKRNGCLYEVAKGYGMTELCATGTTSFCGANAVGSVGVPLVSNTVRIMDIDTGKELGYDCVGEILICAPSAMLGYYKKPEETSSILVTDESGNHWIKTGDLGRINKDGLLFHEGRIRRIYLTTFEGQPAKVFPGLIEDAVRALPDVYDCTAVARYMENSFYYEPVAYIIPHSGHAPLDKLIEELQTVCVAGLPAYMRPVEFRFVSEFPRTPIGKVDYRALERMAAEDK